MDISMVLFTFMGHELTENYNRRNFTGCQGEYSGSTNEAELLTLVGLLLCCW